MRTGRIRALNFYAVPDLADEPAPGAESVGARTGGAGRDAAISASEVSEKTSSNTRWPFSHTRYIRQVGCRAHELLPSVHTLRVMGPSTASMMSRKVMVSALRASW